MKNAYKSIFAILVIGSLFSCKQDQKSDSETKDGTTEVVKDNSGRDLLVADKIEYTADSTTMKGI